MLTFLPFIGSKVSSIIQRAPGEGGDGPRGTAPSSLAAVPCGIGSSHPPLGSLSQGQAPALLALPPCITAFTCCWVSSSLAKSGVLSFLQACTSLMPKLPPPLSLCLSSHTTIFGHHSDFLKTLWVARGLSPGSADPTIAQTKPWQHETIPPSQYMPGNASQPMAAAPRRG